MKDRIIRFIENDVRRALTIALVVVIGTAIMVGRYNDCLTTLQAPSAIVSMELASTHDTAVGIVNSWRDVQYEVKWAIYTDFAFIFAYTFGLFVLLVIAKLAIKNAVIPIWSTPAWVTNIAFVLPIIAFFGDIVENIFMLVFIANNNASVYFFMIPAVIKFASIVMVLIYCIAAPMAHRHILKASRLYAPGLITVLISYFVFIKLDQGQDIMIQVIEYSGPMSWSLLCAILWIWYIWYSSRLVGYAKIQQPGSLVPPSYHKHFPRLIAFNGLVSLQAATLALPTTANLPTSALWLFVILQNGVYFLWDDYIETKRWYSLALVIVFTAGYALGLASIAISLSPTVHEQIGLLIIDGTIFIVALVVQYLWIIRRSTKDEWLINPCEHPPLMEKHLKIFGVKILGLSTATYNSERGWFFIFNLLAAQGLVIYILAFSNLHLADVMGPLAFVLLAFGILVGLSNIITIFSIYRKTNFFFVLFLITIVVGFFYDPFSVRLIEPNPEPRTSMIDYFDKWVEQRKDAIAKSESFPVYLVIADGGASRSGYWVSSVLSELEDQTIRERRDSVLFSDHLLCLAGASGGSVGNATFYAMLKNRQIDQQESGTTYWDQGRQFLRNDFLTPVLTHWLGSDFFQHLVPFKISEDRAGILEKAMERFAADRLKIPFNEPFHSMIDQSGRLPMLFINVTSVHKGQPAVVSSVPVGSFSTRVDIIQQLEAQHKGTIRYSTAVVLGARFPYVSPAGRIDNDYYVDGGYFDNTGAGIVHEMMQKLDSVLSARTFAVNKSSTNVLRGDTVSWGLYPKLHFRLLYLSNSPFEIAPDTTKCSGYKAPVKTIHPLSNDLAAPILTVLGTYGTQTDVNNNRLQTFMSRINPLDSIYTVNLYRRDETIIYPMNWVISDYNLDRMDTRLKKTIDFELNHVLNFDPSIKKPN